MFQLQKAEFIGWNLKRGSRSFKKITGGMALLLLLLIVSACGNSNGSNGGANAAPTAAPSTSPGSAVNSSAAVPAEENETQTVIDAYGETKVPLYPKRIVVIGLEDVLLSLEAPLVYAYGFDGYYLEDQLKKKNIMLSGSADTNPNLEAILAAQPDLIILQKYFTDENGYAELNKIAPTIAYIPDNWVSTITELGKVLGLQDNAQKVVDDYNGKLKTTKEAIVSAVGPDKTVVFMRPSEKDLQVFFPSFAPLIYDKLGLKPDDSIAEFQKESPDDWGINTSLEKLPSIKADYVFAIYGGSIDTEKALSKEKEASTGLENLQVWQSMPAAKYNQVFNVSARTWMSSGPIAEGEVMDEVLASITGKR